MFVLIDYLTIALYGTLVLLALRNIWVIILKQQEYKNLPIPMFYTFALIAVTLRPIYLIFYWSNDPIIFNIDIVQQAAKLCVGVVQDWITLELAIRIHNSKGHSDISETTKKNLRFSRRLIFSLISLAFAAFALAVIVSAH